jgi:uncharacterized protein
MNEQSTPGCIAFEGTRCIAAGNLLHVARKVKEALDRGAPNSILIFDDTTGEPIEIDFRGTLDEVIARLEKTIAVAAVSAAPELESAPSEPRGPGRPKLGVVAREVTLFPRHWDWLNSQPGGASVALRKLVEEARRVNANRDRIRQAQESAYVFLSAMAGNLPGYEEATRALFAGDSARFAEQTEAWPVDIRNHARKIAAAVFQNQAEGGPRVATAKA